MMFDPEQLHDPEFRTRVQAARALIAERVRRGTPTPAEHLAGAVLDEMPDEDDPDAVQAWAPSAAFREMPSATAFSRTRSPRDSRPASVTRRRASNTVDR